MFHAASGKKYIYFVDNSFLFLTVKTRNPLSIGEIIANVQHHVVLKHSVE